MEGGIENEKTKEQLVIEAGKIIYQNLVESGLAAQIVAKSIHAKPFSEDFYTGIKFGYEMGVGEFEEGIWVQPRISNTTGRGSVTTKIYRLGVEGAENTIWANISNVHKKALIQSALEYQMAKYQGELSSAKIMREDGEDEETILRIEKEANEKLLLLERLEKGLKDDSLLEQISSELASLGAKLGN